FSIFAAAVAFITYFSMYAFRKPYAVASFADAGTVWGVGMKSAFVISQTLGYAASKFLGIKFVSEAPRAHRAAALVALIAAAELALLMFAIAPGPWKLAAIALNGLPLGMVWGLVFSFLEGRRTSDALGAVLSASFIMASGVVKSVGAQLLVRGVPEFWMPFATGLLFLPVVCLMGWLLAQMPAPSDEEERLRTRREPMSAAERRDFLFAFLPGALLITFMAMVLTAFRDVRDNFAAEVWVGLGYEGQPGIFGSTETGVAVVVLFVLGLMVIVKDDRRALQTQLALMTGGVTLMGVATLAWDVGAIGGVWWMVLAGIGLFTAYVPAGCFLFDRLIGATKYVGTAVFMIYVTDAFGYGASVAVLLYKNFVQPDLEWVSFLRVFGYFASVTGVVAFGFSLVYFSRRTATPAGE
ncbi:hypothetical protein HOK31_03365, partial [Candidatus Poribacteria bacterium]|nr:hypothetical protein [Candidatus Poribacteria bacterium]